jgi:hypothetical protein
MPLKYQAKFSLKFSVSPENSGVERLIGIYVPYIYEKMDKNGLELGGFSPKNGNIAKSFFQSNQEATLK